jgi:glutamine synthetase
MYTHIHVYTGHRFEFRAVGSSQNVSLVNTVLATITANAFKEVSDAIEKGATPKEVAQKALKDSWKIIFNGNGYDAASQDMLTKAGLCRIDSGVEAMCTYTAPKNVKLFSDMKVMTYIFLFLKPYLLSIITFIFNAF